MVNIPIAQSIVQEITHAILPLDRYQREGIVIIDKIVEINSVS
jgi:hypothetical protein